MSIMGFFGFGKERKKESTNERPCPNAQRGVISFLSKLNVEYENQQISRRKYWPETGRTGRKGSNWHLLPIVNVEALRLGVVVICVQEECEEE